MDKAVVKRLRADARSFAAEADGLDEEGFAQRTRDALGLSPSLGAEPDRGPFTGEATARDAPAMSGQALHRAAAAQVARYFCVATIVAVAEAVTVMALHGIALDVTATGIIATAAVTVFLFP